METPIARAFLVRLLSSVQRESLKTFERGLPRGRYLQPFEISLEYDLHPKPVTEPMVNQMTAVQRQFWKKNEIDKKNNRFPDDTMLDEMHRWDDFSVDNYKDVSIEALNY